MDVKIQGHSKFAGVNKIVIHLGFILNTSARFDVDQALAKLSMFHFKLPFIASCFCLM